MIKSENEEHLNRIYKLEIELASNDLFSRVDNMLPQARYSEVFSERKSYVRTMTMERGSNYQKFSSGFKRYRESLTGASELNGLNSEMFHE